jgi:hypothetical protein
VRDLRELGPLRHEQQASTVTPQPLPHFLGE